MSDNKPSLPNHIGYIVDGNRRWAKKHGLPAYEGHLAGYNTLRDIIIATNEAGVRYISAYIFSTENWSRSVDEVNRLMALILKILKKDIKEFNKRNVRLKVAGSRARLSQKIQDAIDNAESVTADNTGGELILCIDYGGQLEISDAVKKIVQNQIQSDQITPELISSYLYTPEVPPLDAIVRTSGEMRLSNFMLWRSAYSELFFIKKPWPEMTKKDVAFIINEYAKRKRRFGG